MDTWNALMISLGQTIGKQPDSLESVLFIIGIQELGKVEDSFTKEQKQDVMHIGICSVLEKAGFYTFSGKDEEGWPHYDLITAVPPMEPEKEEEFLKNHIINYFAEGGKA